MHAHIDSSGRFAENSRLLLEIKVCNANLLSHGQRLPGMKVKAVKEGMRHVGKAVIDEEDVMGKRASPLNDVCLPSSLLADSGGMFRWLST